MSTTRYTKLVWLPKSTNHVKYQCCRNDLHTVATRGKTSEVWLHVWPKRPKTKSAYATTYVVCSMTWELRGSKGYERPSLLPFPSDPRGWPAASPWIRQSLKHSLLDDTYQKFSFSSTGLWSHWAWWLAVKESPKGFAVLKVLLISRSLF